MKTCTQRLFRAGLLLACAALLPACTDPDTARRVAEDNGFVQVEITGYRWTGCAEKDTYSTGFRAMSPTGRRVTGVVCASLSLFGKTNTLRLD